MEWLCSEAHAWWPPHGCTRHAVQVLVATRLPVPGAAAIELGGARSREQRGAPFEGGGSGSDALRLEEEVEVDVTAAPNSQQPRESVGVSFSATGAGYVSTAYGVAGC